MLVENGTPPQMPIRLPTAETIRREIADVAALVGGEAPSRYLKALGSVEPTWPPTSDDSPWRLSGYVGGYEDIAAIEKAVSVVQRRSPLMRVR